MALVHVTTRCAGRNGHADLTREAPDGVTGQRPRPSSAPLLQGTPPGQGSTPAAHQLQDRRRPHTPTEITQRYGVQNIRVFGSVARRESDQSSDLNLLVDVLPGHGLLAVSAFAGEVE